MSIGTHHQIQLDMFGLQQDGTNGDEELALMRPHRWAHQGMGQLALALIYLARHGESWMWASGINSRNGAAQGYRPAEKWGNFAPSRDEAIERAAEEIRGAIHRVEPDEQKKITDWLGLVLAS
jgi:hypothetical protein